MVKHRRTTGTGKMWYLGLILRHFSNSFQIDLLKGIEALTINRE